MFPGLKPNTEANNNFFIKMNVRISVVKREKKLGTEELTFMAQT